jgi:hypothetical protein
MPEATLEQGRQAAAEVFGVDPSNIIETRLGNRLHYSAKT